MRSLIIFAILLFGMAACETPAPATRSGSTPVMDSPGSMRKTPMRTDTMRTDTSIMKKDTLR